VALSVSYLRGMEIMKLPNVTKILAVQVELLHVEKTGKMKTKYIMKMLIKHTKNK
jgi:hypothetical protein